MPQGILFVIVLILFAWLETSQNIFSYVFAFFECCIKNCKLFKYPAMILYEKYIWLEETLFSPNSTGLMLLVAEGIAKRCERNKFTTIYCITKWKAFLNWFDHIMPRKQIQMIFFFLVENLCSTNFNFNRVTINTNMVDSVECCSWSTIVFAWTSFLINAKSQTDRSLNNFQVAVHITSNQATTTLVIH